MQATETVQLHECLLQHHQCTARCHSFSTCALSLLCHCSVLHLPAVSCLCSGLSRCCGALSGGLGCWWFVDSGAPFRSFFRSHLWCSFSGLPTIPPLGLNPVPWNVPVECCTTMLHLAKHSLHGTLTSSCQKCTDVHSFRHRDSNPGRSGESRVS